jgi:gamma-glutamyltranspeptidase
VADDLKKMGYVLEDQGWEMGDIQAIRVTGRSWRPLPIRVGVGWG